MNCDHTLAEKRPKLKSCPGQGQDMTYVQLNYKCNQNCCFCASDKTGIYEYVNVGPKELSEELSNLSQRTLLHINGGEPTLEPNIFDILREGVRNYPYVCLSTNGIKLADPAFCFELLETGLDGIAIPFFCDNEKLHDRLVGRLGAFKKLDRALYNLLQYSPKHEVDLIFKILPLRPTLDYLSDLPAWWGTIGIMPTEIQISGLHLGDKVMNHPELIPPPNELIKALNNLVRKLLSNNYIFSIQELPLCLLETAVLSEYIETQILRPLWKYRKFVKVDNLGATESWVWVPRFKSCSGCELDEFCGSFNSKRFDEVYKPLYDDFINPIHFR